MRKGRILFADNNKRFLKVRAEFLAAAGYEVRLASSIDEAEQILGQELIHVAILDIRMIDDDDDGDLSGLNLAKEEKYHYIPKIMLTGFPTFEAVRDVLGYTINDLPPAVKFLAKNEGPKTLLQAVEEVFTEYIPINWKLNIRWQTHESLSLPHLVTLIEPGIDNLNLPDRVAELEDLFRRLFYDSNQITICRLFVRTKEFLFLTVLAYSDNTERQFVVGCGQKDVVLSEAEQYKIFAPVVLSGRATVQDRTKETAHYAASTFQLTGGDLEEIVTFSEFCRNHSSAELVAVLHDLFNVTLLAWRKRSQLHPEKKTLERFLSDWAGLNEEVMSLESLDLKMEAICRESLSTGLARLDYALPELTLYAADGRTTILLNPVWYLSDQTEAIEKTFLCGTLHGRLNGDSILVNHQGHTWLIDFRQTGRGPLLHDLSGLEASIKFELLTDPNMQTRYELEEQLAVFSHSDAETVIEAFDEGIEPEMQTARRLIGIIRRHAVSVIGSDTDSYFWDLLSHALKHITTFEPALHHTRQELIPYFHSLLSAAVLCRQLMPMPPSNLPAQAFNTLWIDEANREVWVEGRSINLSPQEFSLLQLLYRQRGQLCTRTMIAEQVFAGEFTPDLSAKDKRAIEEGRINTTISRLRRKIEPDPDRPKYITAVRAVGYKLEAEESA